MRILKNTVVIASILGMIAALGACQRRHEPMKLGAAELPVQNIFIS